MQMISRVTKYRTSDNQEFLNEAEAKAHETQIETLKELGDLLRTSMQTGRMEAVLKHMLLEQDTVRKILYKFHQKQPKPKKPKVAAKQAA
jgi:hypothetical protein